MRATNINNYTSTVLLFCASKFDHMFRLAICSLLLTAIFITGRSQSTGKNQATPALPLAAKADYQPSPEKIWNLIHTKIDVQFDYAQRRMPGKVWLTLQPHFYPSKFLILDAKGMFIHKVALVKKTGLQPLTFSYPDSLQLVIELDKIYQATDKLTVYIEYTARPNEIKVKGSQAITDAKGLYFINADGKDTTKPVQIWTQGETEATSVWCPIIDKTNQKTTQEISMTVPAKYTTLSNGLLVKQVKNANGTRTDTWKMDLPHAPYLFFMGVGEYSIIKDKYKNLAVDYYVEPKYASVAKGIFGETPAMMSFFSKLLGVEFPWQKYAQIVGRDYVSGAMENTSSTLHGSSAYQNARQLKDGNSWEIVVAHELFHQWFGDLVTAESWCNLTVNESMADYSEYLWMEYRYGKDRALEYNREAMEVYLSNPNNAGKHLVRFQYADKEDMFDGVSYQKGGRILNMLRQYLGDSAFFKGLNVYLSTNKFKNAEAHQLRLAMEEVSGRDLNWFFDQWYFANGHPKVSLHYQFIDSTNQLNVIVEQQQKDKLFYFPLSVDIYSNGKAERSTQWIGKQVSDTIRITYSTKPNWVNVDPEKLMLWEKDNNLEDAMWLAQMQEGKNHLDKVEALEALAPRWKNEPSYYNALQQLLQDAYYGTRKAALKQLKRGNMNATPAVLAIVEKMAITEPDLPTRAMAIDVLSMQVGKDYTSLLQKALQDSSYSVAGAALESMARLHADKAVAAATTQEQDAKGRLKAALQIVEYLKKDTAEATTIVADFKKMAFFEKLQAANGMLYYANRLTNTSHFKKAVGSAVDVYKMLPMDFQGWQTNILSTIRWMIAVRQQALSNNPNDALAIEQLKYLQEKTGLH